MHNWYQQHDDVSNFFLSTFKVKHPAGERDSVDQITVQIRVNCIYLSFLYRI